MEQFYNKYRYEKNCILAVIHSEITKINVKMCKIQNNTSSKKKKKKPNLLNNKIHANVITFKH